MNKKNIIWTIRKFYTEFLKNIDDESIKSLIKNHTFVTGGAIVSLLLDESPNDYDIYFDDERVCKKVLKYFLNKLNKKEITDYHFDDYVDYDTKTEEIKDRVKLYIPGSGMFTSKKYTSKFHPIFVSTNAMTLTDKAQLIFRFVGNPDIIHENYDFDHTKCYYVYKTNELVLPQSSLESILTKELKYSGSKYPLASIIRTRKFIQRGWNINAGQFLKMALQLQSFDLSNPIILSDQLTGVDIILFSELIERVKSMDFTEDDDILEYITSMIDDVFDNTIMKNLMEEDKKNEEEKEDFDDDRYNN